jgi:BarA-like signal transduction histidine kinase
MADKLMRTAVVMTFFLILALFSSCGTNGNSLTSEENGTQITQPSGNTLILTLEANS